MIDDRLEGAGTSHGYIGRIRRPEHVFVILVFDAYRVKGHSGVWRKHMDVVFTQETVTADRYIESEIASMGRMDDVSVATSDFVEQQIIMARGGQAHQCEGTNPRKKRQGPHAENRPQYSYRQSIFHILDDDNRKKLERLKKELS